MNLSAHAPKSFTDPTWIDKYIEKMGESAFWEYKAKLYDLLDNMEVGCELPIAAWVEVWNYDLFVKLACFYVSESNYCYQIDKEYTSIKKNFDARKMEETFALLRKKRREKDAGGDGGGTERKKRGSKTISPPKQALQSQPG